MSRHRNVRSTNFYSEECEGFDDVYGHSVEDDYCVSPSVAEQFLYDRSRRQQMSVFLGQEEEIAEEDEEEEGGEDNPGGMAGVPKCVKLTSTKGLSDVDQARLQSCLEEVRNVVGDSIAEQTVVEAVLRSDFNVEKALNMVLNNATGANASGALKMAKADPRKEKDVCSNFNSSSSPRVSNNNKVAVLSSEELTVVPQAGSGICEVYHKGMDSDSSALEIAVGPEGNLSTLPVVGLPTTGCAQPPLPPVDGEGEAIGGGTIPSIGRGFSAQASIHLSSTSDSEDEDDASFPSLHSLVIHNTSAQGMSPSSLESRSGGDACTKEKKPQAFEWSAHSGMDLKVGTGDDSEDSEDEFSSLCSLVVHNQNKKGPVLPKPHTPFTVPTLFPPQKTIVKVKTAGLPKPSLQSNSSSEEEDFSSLQSFVIRNRSAPTEDEVSGGHCRWAQPQSAQPHSAQPQSSQHKATGSDNSEKDDIPKNAVAVKDSDSDDDDDNYSSLCSLVIHNRNTPSSGQDSSGRVPIPTVGELEVKGGSSDKVVGMRGGTFVIPPLLVTSKPKPGSHLKSIATESEESEEGDDYVIDLCGTLKSLDVESISSVEESEAQDDPTQVNFPPEGEGSEKKDMEWSILEEGWVHEPVEGMTLLDVNSGKLSPFGRVLCKNWECLKRLECPVKKVTVNGTSIMAFLFDKESPDDICRRLRSQKYLIQVKTAKFTS